MFDIRYAQSAVVKALTLLTITPALIEPASGDVFVWLLQA